MNSRVQLAVALLGLLVFFWVLVLPYFGNDLRWLYAAAVGVLGLVAIDHIARRLK